MPHSLFKFRRKLLILWHSHVQNPVRALELPQRCSACQRLHPASSEEGFGPDPRCGKCAVSPHLQPSDLLAFLGLWDFFLSLLVFSLYIIFCLWGWFLLVISLSLNCVCPVIRLQDAFSNTLYSVFFFLVLWGKIVNCLYFCLLVSLTQIWYLAAFT